MDMAVTTLIDECRAPGFASQDYVALQRAGRRVRKAIASGEIAGPPVRIAVVSSFLSDMVVDLLPALLLRRGVVATIAAGPYGGIATEILNPGGGVCRGADLVMVLPTHRDLAHAPGFDATRADSDAAVAREVADWQGLWSALAVPTVQLSFDPPPDRPLGELDGLSPGGLLFHARSVNRAIAEAVPAHVTVVDAEALAQRVGPAWHDAALYALCKQPFGAAALVEVADTLAAAAAGQLGKARKVLVLDLDNTVWGGVVGDVGLAGLVLGRETAEGEAFLALQAYAKRLAGRGVILAVCSKNREDLAREPFRDHPSMILKEEDIACFVANFDDKATNLRRIAATLNVGLDSLVFVDDNPVERAWVQRELGEVLVVDLPEDPAGYCAAIEREKAFPTSRITGEDLRRNALYRTRAETIAQAGAAHDIDAFLASLEPVAEVEPVGPASLDRIVQLIAKTNQFKLNPTVFTPDEITANRDGVIAIRFKDRLQDHGITAIAVTEPEDGALVIRNWVMSCRVFSRRLEHATLELIRRRAARLDLDRIVLDFRLSPKNALVKDVLAELGFEETSPEGRYAASLLPQRARMQHHISIVTPDGDGN
ncbi:FkbH-like protein [Inquilinus ginsengisoli]|uniref:FkbH-like protein n=1 Tax=Inquilinus ginsengisoli TaxID=363840 RepID=A0ABU1JK15_9PROT|nr:HAD-IIIC family phosphatase [Inquilinus ginsengisoli]MDR6288956.1 FkbH-like protein [Inquilinus ginsengisoli]